MGINRYAKYDFSEGWASVSEICGMLAKPFLYGWYAKLGAEAHRVNAHSKKIGNLIDNEICHYFGDKETPELDKTVLDHPESKAYYHQAIHNFHTLAEAIKPKSIVGQQVVYSKKHRYIGTFDRLMLVDGLLVLSDWKATNTVSYEYLMQLEAYYQALMEVTTDGTLKIEGFGEYKWHEYPLWLVQFPKKEKVDLDKHIVKFKPKPLRFNNFLNLLSFHYGKQEDEQEGKDVKKAAKLELKEAKIKLKKGKK